MGVFRGVWGVFTMENERKCLNDSAMPGVVCGIHENAQAYETCRNVQGAVNEETRLFFQSLEDRKCNRKSLSIYRSTMGYFVEWLASRNVRSFTQVNRQQLTDYMSYLNKRLKSAVSREVYFRVVKLLFSYLEERQLIFINPADGLGFRVSPKLKAAPTVAAIRALIDAVDISTPAGVRNRAMLEVLYGTGVRREELCRMNIEDLNIDDQTLKVLGKGAKERLLPVGASLVEWLKQYLGAARPALMQEAQSSAMWVVQGGGRIGYEAIQGIIRLCREKVPECGNITAHDFRRAFATHMLQNGASPVDIQALLGHSSLKHLSRYLRLSIVDLRKMHKASRVGQ